MMKITLKRDKQKRPYQLQLVKHASTTLLSDTTLLSLSVIMGVAIIYLIFTKCKNNDGDNQNTPCPKKTLDEDCT